MQSVKGIFPWLLVLLTTLLAGCASTGPESDRVSGKLVVQLQFLPKDDIRLEKPATIYADGVLLGNCEAPGEVAAELAPGPHTISIEIPWAWQFSKGERQRAIALAGEQTVEIAGRGKTQVLLFDLEHLRKKGLAD